MINHQPPLSITKHSIMCILCLLFGHWPFCKQQMEGTSREVVASKWHSTTHILVCHYCLGVTPLKENLQEDGEQDLPFPRELILELPVQRKSEPAVHIQPACPSTSVQQHFTRLVGFKTYFVIRRQVCKMWVQLSCKRGDGVITAKSSLNTNLAEGGGRGGMGILVMKLQNLIRETITKNMFKLYKIT